jgi:hypothetical protein
LILRLKIGSEFKEFHIKIFNTGKLEIPGIKCNVTFNIILDKIIEILQPHAPEGIILKYKEDMIETILINANFNCGFYIDREILYNILKSKYNLQTLYDPCSYPGIQCKFYYNPELLIQTGVQISDETKKNAKEISLMIFRTGSVLIVGKCEENVIYIVYNFIKEILKNEHKIICQINIKPLEKSLKEKNKKIRKKVILVDN